MFAANCPSRESLSAYALGKLPEDVFQAVADHIDTCPTCQAALAGLDDADDTLLARLRRPMAAGQYVQEPQCGQALAQLKAAAKSLSHGGISASGPPSETVMLGQLGEYQLLEKLGQGGMGTVYKALHTKLRREVALKVLPKHHLPDDQAVARFEREMAAVGALNHPNIVQAFDAREIEGTRFLVMEYVEGLNLTEVVRRLGPLPVPDAAAVARQVAKGLQAAHEHRMVHRDVKPSNLMLARKGQVKILDLGLARFHRDERMSSEEMTAVYQVMGTPDYMAPEQISNSHQVDIRADIYSLGCTMYKLLVGHPPFSGSRYQSIFEKQEAHAKHKPPPLKQFRTDVPEALVAVVERMMSKDASHRYATPGEVAADLEAFTAGCDLPGLLARAVRTESPPVNPLWSGASTPHHRESALTATQGPESPWFEPPMRPARRRRKRRWPLVALMCLLLLAGAGALGAWWWYKEHNGKNNLATPRETLYHDHEVWSVAFSPNNQTLVSAGVDDVIKVWDTNNASKPWQTLPENEGQGKVRSVTFSPDGRTLVSGGEDGAIRTWDTGAAAFEKGPKIAAHNDEVRSLAFSPDGGLLVSGGYDSTVKFWDPAIGEPKEPRSIDAHDGSVLSVAYAPGAEIVASAGSDSMVKLWDLTGTEIATLRGHSGGVRCVVFSPDGQTLVSGSTDETIRLWDVASRRLIRAPLQGHSGEVRCVAFSPDGKTLVSGGDDATIRLWDARTGREKQVLTGHKKEVTSLAFSPDGRTLASASADKTVQLWNIPIDPGWEYKEREDAPKYPPPVIRKLDEPKPPPGFVIRDVLTGHEGAVRSLAFSPDSDKLASAAADQTIRLWDVRSGEPVQVFGGMSAAVRSLSFSRDGRSVTAADGSDTIRIWPTDKPGEKPRVLKGKGGSVWTVAFSPKDNILAAAGNGNRITLWELKSGSPKNTLDGFDQGIGTLIYSPDGKMLAAGGEGWVTLYYPDGAFLLGAFRAQTDEPPIVAISADGKTLAKTSRDTSILLWDFLNDKEQATLVGHKGPVRSIAFSPDGTVVVSAGGENGFRVWNPRTGKELGISGAHDKEVLAVAFSPDGKTMASAGADRKIILWDIKTESLLPPKKAPPEAAPAKKTEKNPGKKTEK